VTVPGDIITLKTNSVQRMNIKTLIFISNALRTVLSLSFSSNRPRTSTRRRSNISAGPKAESSRRRDGRSSRRVFNKDPIEVFDPKKLTNLQKSNADAPPLDLQSISSIRLRSSVDDSTSRGKTMIESDDSRNNGQPIGHNHFEQLSLDHLFPNLNFSEKFCTDQSFRDGIRHAMRNDIFYSTPAYANLSPKVAELMLDDDSSLQGSWNCIPLQNRELDVEEKMGNEEHDIPPSPPPLRMARLTSVLRKTLGPNAPSGDEFLMNIGCLCGVHPSNHWIDIIGVKDKIVSHSWHQDTGRSYDDDDDGDDDNATLDNSCYTVMLGFPLVDGYVGTGVFSHAIKLSKEQLAPLGHNFNEPVLFEGTAEEKYIVRPVFEQGKEILRYRDVDTLHSAPDVVYRKSVMRFM